MNNIDAVFAELDRYFDTVSEEHFAEVCEKLEKYNAYGPTAEEYLGAVAQRIHVEGTKVRSEFGTSYSGGDCAQALAA